MIEAKSQRGLLSLIEGMIDMADILEEAEQSQQPKKLTGKEKKLADIEAEGKILAQIRANKAVEADIKDIGEIPKLKLANEQGIATNKETKDRLEIELEETESLKASLEEQNEQALLLAGGLQKDITAIRSFTVNKSAYIVKLMESILKRATTTPVERLIKFEGYGKLDICQASKCPMTKKCEKCAKELEIALTAVGIKLAYDKNDVYLPTLYGRKDIRKLDDAGYLASLLDIIKSNKKTKDGEK